MISDSAFYMWRTVFALAHIDGVVTDEEKKFMRDTLEEVNFSLEQKEELENDIHTPHDPAILYKKISQPKHKQQFFQYAKTMVWIDGDFADDERQVLERLKTMHKFNSMSQEKPVSMSIEDQKSNDNTAEKAGNFRSVLNSLKKAVVNDQGSIRC